MREIKFRAWDNQENRMVYPGEFVPFANTRWEMLDNFEDWEIMQYTWLKDKNWIEIWEWDVALIFWVKSEIRYSNTWCWFVFFDKDRPIELQELPFYDWTKWNYTECEIIGNIYDLWNQSK